MNECAPAVAADEGHMLGGRNPRPGLLEADTLYADFVGRDTFSSWLASQRGALSPDELFAGCSADGWGRPSVPPSLLATALVLQTSAGVFGRGGHRAGGRRPALAGGAGDRTGPQAV